MMMTLDVQPALDHRLHHLAAQILIMIRRWYREVAFLIPRPVTQVVLPPPRVPPPFLGVDKVKSRVLVLVEADVVENEKLRLGPEVRRVRHPAVGQVQFRFARDPPRIPLITLLGDRILHVADHNQRRRLRKRVHQRRLRIRNQQHVAFVDRRPAADARSVHSKPVLEAALVELAHRVGNVMLQARNIGEPQIQLLGIVLLGKFQYFFRSHSSSRDKIMWEL